MEIDRVLLLKRWVALKSERSSWIYHWKEISDNLLPRSGRFFIQDRDRGNRRHNNIQDSTGTRALRILAAGMMSGMTSPARPWFRLATSDLELMKSEPVKVWLNEATTIILTIFQRSNIYRMLHSLYEELGAFGTGAAIIVPDFENVIHAYPLTVGEYAIATNWKGEVTTLYREFQKSVHEVVSEFGYENCSGTVQAMYDVGNLDSWVTIIHAVEPREDRDPSKRDSKNMPWRSIYFELVGDHRTFLRESGFQRFPAVCPRWSVSGGDIYGNCPGQEALGDIKQLQHEQIRKSEGIDYETAPPIVVPSSLKNRDVDMLPKGITYADIVGDKNAIRPLFQVNRNLEHLRMDINEVQARINATFYADMFLMVAEADKSMTATEVAERHEEKMLMLGPVIERLQNELLDPLVETTFNYAMEAGILPPPPDELQGHELNIELVSMLAQAQRAIANNSIDRFVVGMFGLAQGKPGVLDNLDEDNWARIYSESLGIDPSLMRPKDEVAAMRQQRAEQAAAQQQAAMMQQAADSAAKLGTVKTAEPNALTDVMRQFSGYG
ncbi:MAG: hypothetical protein LBE24_04045 [Methylobacillus sp.]|jgi:hypothetical protein|nr:hypothetical protein [Methylobacillus sp.]